MLNIRWKFILRVFLLGVKKGSVKHTGCLIELSIKIYNCFNWELCLKYSVQYSDLKQDNCILTKHITKNVSIQGVNKKYDFKRYVYMIKHLKLDQKMSENPHCQYIIS